MNNLEWEDLRLFLAVAEMRGMSAAARRLRVGQPTVSRRLAALEAELGYALFRRSVAGVTLTAAGERLVAPARKMAEWAAEVDRAARAQEQRPRGVVRVTAPPGVAWELLVPFAAALKLEQPGLQLELLSTVHYLDLARGEADLALRFSVPTAAPVSSDLTTVATLRHAVRVMAAPGLVAKLPRRYGFADVPFIGWAPPFDQVAPNPQLRALVPDLAFAFTSDNYLVQMRAAELGLGAVIRGELRHRWTPKAGKSVLVPLKLDLGPYDQAALQLVCAKSALDIARVRLVAERLAAEMARMNG